VIAVTRRDRVGEFTVGRSRRTGCADDGLTEDYSGQKSASRRSPGNLFVNWSAMRRAANTKSSLSLRGVRPELLAESRRHKAIKLLRQIPCIGPIRTARLLALMQTPHRFRSKRQLWTYSGLGVETRDSAQYRFVDRCLRIIIECPERILHVEAGYIYADCLFAASNLLQSGGGPYIFIS
jgi:transposase IS116/IS110/IS902 family protein